MNSKIASRRILKSLAVPLAGAAWLALSGCLMQQEGGEDFSSDGQPAYLASEVDQMGEALNALAQAPLAKGAAAAYTIEGELVIDPYRYDPDCQCFVRRARYTGSRGYERVRLDSVTLLDETGTPLEVFDAQRLSRVVHKRHVTHEKGARQADIRFNTEMQLLRENGSTVGVWNGIMTGTYNGREFRSGSITDVKRPFVDGRFRFPESGTIEAVRPIRSCTVEFLGDGRVKATIRNRRTGRIHVLWIDRNYQEGEAEEQ